MTYALLVFTHAAPTKKLQVLQNKFCRSATNAHWCVRNSFLHRDVELPKISKHMKNLSERFFSIVVSHPNLRLSAAASYEVSPLYHFISRTRNALTDPPDALTSEVAG
ncbi:RNA-directed DNA polymerase from mobile element jockey [Eumeta japonica]|uniref:RNA-directed DNA polymerase from mobile element jockey n=1 Tax=Eumeta variegata TaxID=151549 RepID=A0A4C1WR71_EUMVA|nr:RNA-directed DNA polymerase from mobile element jockey [Eumeta japonica]